jgi:hypothetical protein
VGSYESQHLQMPFADHYTSSAHTIPEENPMSEESTTQRALQIALSTQPALTTLTAPEDQNPDPDSPKPAIRRCCSAWQRAFKAYMKRQAKSGVDVPDENTGDQNDEEEDRSYDHIFAEKEAGVAYCNAMPMLAGHEGVATSLPALPTASSSEPFLPSEPASSSTPHRLL